MLAGILMVPGVYVLVLAWQFWPAPEKRRLHDEVVAQLLGMNASDVIIVAHNEGVLIKIISPA